MDFSRESIMWRALTTTLAAIEEGETDGSIRSNQVMDGIKSLLYDAAMYTGNDRYEEDVIKGTNHLKEMIS